MSEYKGTPEMPVAAWLVSDGPFMMGVLTRVRDDMPFLQEALVRESDALTRLAAKDTEIFKLHQSVSALDRNIYNLRREAMESCKLIDRASSGIDALVANGFVYDAAADRWAVPAQPASKAPQ